MPREKKTKKLRSETIYEDWLAGKGHRLKGGDVVRKKVSNGIGVIQFALCEMETYQVKWYMGPKPWDYIEGVAQSKWVDKVNEPNPLKYKWSERVPGPSSDEIDRLEAAFAKQKSKERTAREVELHVAALEEEINKKKSQIIDETKVDSIVDDTLEEDTTIPTEERGVDRKLKGILEEE